MQNFSKNISMEILRSQASRITRKVNAHLLWVIHHRQLRTADFTGFRQQFTYDGRSKHVLSPAASPGIVSARQHPSAHDQKDDRYMPAYLRSLSQPEDFWSEQASSLVWDKKYDRVLDNSDSPFTKWFPGGKISVCYNALDRHCDEGRGDQVALIHESPVSDSRSQLTYKQVLHEVRLLAGLLCSLGVKKGDRVIIYMPMIPQAVIAMLACSRVGAIHCVVFGGFAAKELATRISHARAVAVICGSFGIERNREVDYKKIVDEAIAKADHKPQNVVVFQRQNTPKILWVKGRDHDWEDALTRTNPVDCVPLDSMDPLYILYTSGTTGAPKAVVRPSAGYAVALNWSMQSVYGMKPGDIWWSASDLGWVVGHSYICYAPLLHGNPSVIYEGKVTDTPDAGSFFRVVEKCKVTGMFTTPTAMRAIMQSDPEVRIGKRYDVNSLKNIFIAGEHCDERTKSWTQQAFDAPVLDNWWQTETGWAMTATCVGLGSSLNPPPGTSGHAVPGTDIRVLDSDTGKELKAGEMGRLAVKLPLPPGNFSGLWENADGFRKIYFERYPGYYDTMDAGSVDVDGYVSVLSRVDDVINVSGVRISTSAIEEAVLRHPDLAECAVIGVRDALKGHIPVGLLVLKNGHGRDEDEIISEVISQVRDDVGPVASFKRACIVKKLPKTRSGKIVRASLVSMAENEPVKIPPTIEDSDVYPEIRNALQKIGLALKQTEIP